MYSPFIAEDMDTTMFTCDDASVTETTVSCTINNLIMINRTYHFLVEDETAHNFVTMKNFMPDLIAEDTFPTELPVIASANGSCAEESAECVDGANITFNGKKFAEYAPDGYHVNIENLTGAECVVLNTTNTSLTCTLHNVNTKKGMFVMTVQIR